ncbi:EamA-like transporter family protein [Labrenzia sp. THAF191b]|uniref:DMT family transporter n=1 Tax=unclassified Labrenzia TaxID=2648686 RepID=UPI00126936AA|nr:MULTISPECIES: DMT family transporter [unclassified Labrenzia]QFS99986.1 EamA-like transporter family protein [Labrenzia sp. THAF191b]QFT06300.1 EamA-like transporter family protein [Labrenzia sp. THAF191a]QFT17844.1 EamA-like transporter family protein [Labrenzia sp. THAF187b]
MSQNSVYHRPENTLLALLLALAGMAAFTPIFAAGKLSGGLLPVAVLVWLRFIGGAATIVSVAAVKRVPVFTRVSPLWKLHLMRAFCGVGGLACSIYAASVLPLADATAIGLTKGIIAIVLAGLVLKEVITGRHWVAGVLCAAGAYLVVRSAEGSAGYDELALAGVMSALMGAVFMACEALIMRYIAQREDTVTILAYVNVFAAVLLSGPVLWLIVKEGVSWNDLLIFAWMGPLAIIGQSMNISAYRRAGAATLAPVYYGTVVLSAVFGFAVWGEVPTRVAVFGAVLIVAGGAILTLPNPFRKFRQAS